MFFTSLPINIDPIISFLKNKDWIIANFKNNDLENYNIADYLYNKNLYKVEYYLFLDRNIYSYIVNSYKSTNINDNHRAAIGLVIFCQVAEIIIKPSLALHEGVNYSHLNIEQIITEKELFDKIYNSDIFELYNFSIGKIDLYKINDNIEFDCNYSAEKV